MDKYVPAGVAALLVSDNKILLGKRFVNQCFEGWQCPGGFLQINETLEIAAQRVCLQKAGIQIENIEAGPFTNNIFHSSSGITHSVTIYAIARRFKVMDADIYADQQRGWQWIGIDEIPSPAFQPLQLLLNNYDLRSLLSL